MADLQITVKTVSNSVHIHIEYPRSPEISYNFKLQMQILEQKLVAGNQVHSSIYKKIFHTQQNEIEVRDLGYSKMYKVQATNSFGREGIMKTQNYFVYTPARPINDQDAQFEQQPNSNNLQVPSSIVRPRPNSSGPSSSYSNSRGKHTNKSSQLSNSQLLVKAIAENSCIVNKQKAHKYILQSRKCRNASQFINQKYGKRVNREEVGDKQMMIIQSKILFSQIYGFREGYRYFGNDWRMGPFYSYDMNENQIRKQ